MGLNRVRAGIAKEPIRGPLARQLQYQKLSERWKERRMDYRKNERFSLIPSQEEKGTRKLKHMKSNQTSKSNVLSVRGETSKLNVFTCLGRATIGCDASLAARGRDDPP